jgi:hypothetical protein
MALNMKKMKRDYEKHQKNGDWWQPPNGDTLVYIHPQCREDDKYEPTEGLNYIEVGVHYQIGGKMVVSLDKSANPILTHPFVKAQLKKKGVKISGPCPIAKAIREDMMSDDEADASRRQQKFLFGVTPLYHRESKTKDWKKLDPNPQVYLAGKTIYEGILELFCELGDITGMEEATLVLIHREGKGKHDTKYKVSPCLDKGIEGSVNTPMEVSGTLRARVEKALDDDCDLFKVVASMVKSTTEVEQLLSGIEMVDDDEEEEPEAPRVKDDEDDDIPDFKLKSDESEDVVEDEDDELDALDKELERISKSKKSKR